MSQQQLEDRVEELKAAYTALDRISYDLHGQSYDAIHKAMGVIESEVETLKMTPAQQSRQQIAA